MIDLVQSSGNSSLFTVLLQILCSASRKLSLVFNNLMGILFIPIMLPFYRDLIAWRISSFRIPGSLSVSSRGPPLSNSVNRSCLVFILQLQSSLTYSAHLFRMSSMLVNKLLFLYSILCVFGLKVLQIPQITEKEVLVPFALRPPYFHF